MEALLQVEYARVAMFENAHVGATGDRAHKQMDGAESISDDERPHRIVICWSAHVLYRARLPVHADRSVLLNRQIGSVPLKRQRCKKFGKIELRHLLLRSFEPAPQVSAVAKQRNAIRRSCGLLG